MGHAAVAHPTPCQGATHTHLPLVSSQDPLGALHSATHVRRSHRLPYQGAVQTQDRVARSQVP